jgi:hypothetical protein
LQPGEKAACYDEEHPGNPDLGAVSVSFGDCTPG